MLASQSGETVMVSRVESYQWDLTLFKPEPGLSMRYLVRMGRGKR
jgi:hypothetical protein